MSITESLRPLCNYYNNFFHPNICHVCKSQDQEKLKLCACYMISYCCKQHRKEHRPEHRDICKIIIDVSKKRNIWNTRFMTIEGWSQFKMANMQYMKQKLHRNLKPYEEQMFLFAKSCIICHKQDDLHVSCEVCMSVNVCTDHYLSCYDHSCLLLRHYLEIETEKMWRERQNTAIQETPLCIDRTNVHNMWSLIRESLYNQISEFCYDHYIYTDVFSTPLTLFYGMQDANLSHLFDCGSFVVHIITEEVIDIHYLSAWESVLHELRPCTKLEIIVIGPKLKENYYSVHICSVCINAKKTLQYECHRMLYHDFVRILHMRPNVILALNMEFRNKDTSAKVIKAIQCQRCPLILTSKSKSKAQENMIEIQNALQSSLIPTITQNAFASCKPCRDYENYSVFFPNEYLIVYPELK